MSCPECEKKERKIRELHEKVDQYCMEADHLRVARDQLQQKLSKLESGKVAEELKHIIRRARVILNEVL